MKNNHMNISTFSKHFYKNFAKNLKPLSLYEKTKKFYIFNNKKSLFENNYNSSNFLFKSFLNILK
jgi:hypothetical protein